MQQTVIRHPLIDALRAEVAQLRQQLTTADAEIQALRAAREIAVRMSVWGGQRVTIATRDEK